MCPLRFLIQVTEMSQTHTGHRHKDLEDIEMVHEPEPKDKSLELVVTVEDRDELSLPLANSTLNMEETVTEPMKCNEKSETVIGVSVTHKISVKKRVEITNDLSYFKLCDNRDISYFMVEEEELGSFSVEVSCLKKEYLKDFTFSRAAN